MNEDLIGTWYVYRYNVSRHVLKEPDTALEITEKLDEGEDFAALFQVSGLEKKVRVEMIFDPRTESWFGEDRNIDFRFERVDNRGVVMLIGHASDRTNLEYRDFFIAVKVKRKGSLPWNPESSVAYHFGPSYESSLQRKKRIKKGGDISIVYGGVIDRDVLGEIVFNDRHYDLKSAQVFKGGVKFAGEEKNNPGENSEYARKIWLWLFSLDRSTDRLLATGYCTGPQDDFEFDGLRAPGVTTWTNGGFAG